MKKTFRQHLKSSGDLETTNESYRAGFIALALERNHRATPFVERARVLKAATSHAKTPAELLDMENIRSAMLTAAGVSDNIEPKMATEIWSFLESGIIENAANLTSEAQVASLTRWLCSL